MGFTSSFFYTNIYTHTPTRDRVETRGQFLRVICLISLWDLTSWAVSLPSSRIFVRVPPPLTSTPAPSGPRWPAAEEGPVCSGYDPCARLKSRGLVQSPALQGTPTRIQHEFPTEGGGGGGKEYLETGEPAGWGPGALEGWGWSATCLGRRSGDKEGPSTPGGPEPAPANPDSK